MLCFAAKNIKLYCDLYKNHYVCNNIDGIDRFDKIAKTQQKPPELNREVLLTIISRSGTTLLRQTAEGRGKRFVLPNPDRAISVKHTVRFLPADLMSVISRYSLHKEAKGDIRAREQACAPFWKRARQVLLPTRSQGRQ